MWLFGLGLVTDFCHLCNEFGVQKWFQDIQKYNQVHFISEGQIDDISTRESVLSKFSVTLSALEIF